LGVSDGRPIPIAGRLPKENTGDDFHYDKNKPISPGYRRNGEQMQQVRPHLAAANERHPTAVPEVQELQVEPTTRRQATEAEAMTTNRSWKQFRAYAIAHGVHNGPSTLKELEQLYDEHKGSHYRTIVELFLARGRLMTIHAEAAEEADKP